jgi:2'-5' RNA ligase
MNTRTIMIFPEFSNIGIIQGIRSKFDPLAELVQPHITLVRPFMSDVSVEWLSQHISDRLSDIRPFELLLKGFSKRQDKYGNYLVLDVAQGGGMLEIIRDRLYSNGLQGFAPDYPYIPHLTVGKLPSAEALDMAFKEVSKTDLAFQTVVRKISVEKIGDREESIIVFEMNLSREPSR